MSTLTSIAPTGAPVGPAVTLAATGTGFVDPAVTPPGSRLTVNGALYATTYVSATKLTTSIVPDDLRTVQVGVSDGTGTASFNMGMADGADGSFVSVGTLTFLSDNGAISTVVGTVG